MGKIIAIANHKGGVGKTTSTAFIGEGLALKGKKVLLVDLDAQANLTNFFTDQEIQTSIYDALVHGTRPQILKVSEFLHIIPSELALARAESELSSRMAREKVLYKVLKPLIDDFDYILLDCPPALGIITSNAFAACSEIYVPLTAEALPLKGMAMLEEVVTEARESLNPVLEISGIIITRYNNRNLNKAVLEAIQESYGNKVFRTKIRENISIAEVPVCGGNIFEYAPNSKGAEDYASLVDEILQRE